MNVEVAYIPFGEWVQKKRAKLSFYLQVLAEKANIDASTISRVERQETQATLLTAIQISEALGSDLIEYVASAYSPEQAQRILKQRMIVDHKGSSLQRSYTEPPNLIAREPGDALSSVDIGAFLGLYAKDSIIGQGLLYNWLDRVVKLLNQSPTIPLKSTQLFDITMLLGQLAPYRFELEYPLQIQSSTIIEFLRQDGVVIPEDIMVLLEQIALSPEYNLSGKAKEALKRLRLTSINRAKLNDVIVVSEVLDFNLLKMFWEAAQFNERIVYDRSGQDSANKGKITWQEEHTKLVRTFVLISRWLACENDIAGWLTQMRSEIALATTKELGKIAREIT